MEVAPVVPVWLLLQHVAYLIFLDRAGSICSAATFLLDADCRLMSCSSSMDCTRSTITDWWMTLVTNVGYCPGPGSLG